MVLVALFFFSCEDLSTFGFENPQKKFNIDYIDIPLQTSVFVIDSIVTDHRSQSSSGNVFVGKYLDPDFGNIAAQPFLKIYRTRAGLMPDSLKFDSVTVTFRLNLYSYGAEGTLNPKFTVHEITSDTIGTSTPHFNFSSFGYDPNPLGTASTTVTFKDLQDNLAKTANAQDTFLISAKLSQEFGQRLYDNLRTVDFILIPDTTKAQRALATAQRKDFHLAFKGLTLVPDPGSNSIIGMNIFSAFASLNLHYHTAIGGVKGTVYYPFDSPSFTNITADRSGTELAGAVNKVDFMPASGKRYIESGVGVVTKIDLSNFYDFAEQDSAANILVNSAELIIDDITYPTGMPPHGAFDLQVLKEGNVGMDSTIAEEFAAMNKNYVTSVSNAYFVTPDAPGTLIDVADLSYDGTDKKFSTFITRFTHILTRNIHENIRIESLAILPETPAINGGVNRAVFDSSKIHLRIYYTRPINPK